MVSKQTTVLLLGGTLGAVIAGALVVNELIKAPTGPGTTPGPEPTPTPDLVIENLLVNPQVGDAPLTVSFEIISKIALVAIFWDFGDGGTKLNTKTTGHTYFSPGVYSGKVSATAFDGRISERSFTIIVNEPPGPTPPDDPTEPPVTNIISRLNQGNGSLIGNNFIVPFSISLAVPSRDILSITWKWGDGTSNTFDVMSIDHTYFSKGTFAGSVTVLLRNGQSETKNFSVTTPENIPTGPQGNILVLSKVENVYSFFANFQGTGLTYRWNFGDGTPIVSGSQTIEHAFGRVGTFTVSVEVTDFQGQKGTDTIPVSIRSTDLQPEVGDIQFIKRTTDNVINPLDVSFVSATQFDIVIDAFLKNFRKDLGINTWIKISVQRQRDGATILSKSTFKTWIPELSTRTIKQTMGRINISDLPLFITLDINADNTNKDLDVWTQVF